MLSSNIFFLGEGRRQGYNIKKKKNWHEYTFLKIYFTFYWLGIRKTVLKNAFSSAEYNIILLLQYKKLTKYTNELYN